MIDRETRKVASYILALVALIAIWTYFVAASQTSATPISTKSSSGPSSGGSERAER